MRGLDERPDCQARSGYLKLCSERILQAAGIGDAVSHKLRPELACLTRLNYVTFPTATGLGDMTMNVQDAREQMIDQQIRAWNVLDARVLSVMTEVPRERFVPARYTQLAFADTAIPLADGQSMLIPSVEGRMLQALDVKRGDLALEVGTGSGYTAACLAALGARVSSLEINASLAEQAAARHADLGLSAIKVETTDAAQLDVSDKYDVIAVTGSVPTFQDRFARALKVGGRLFVVVGTPPAMEAIVVTRTGTDAWISQSLFETVVPPLQNFDPERKFEF